MKYLIFPKFHINHLLFLSYFLIDTAENIINHYLSPTKDIVITFHKYYIYSLSDFLSIIPKVIIRKRAKIRKDDNKETENSNTKNIEYIDIDFKV